MTTYHFIMFNFVFSFNLFRCAVAYCSIISVVVARVNAATSTITGCVGAVSAASVKSIRAGYRVC